MFWASRVAGGSELCAAPRNQAGSQAGDEGRSDDRGTPVRGAGLFGATAVGTATTGEGTRCRWAKSNRKKDLRTTERGTMASRSMTSVETGGLNSNQVLATLFSLERKGIRRQLPGKQSNKIRL